MTLDHWTKIWNFVQFSSFLTLAHNFCTLCDTFCAKKGVILFQKNNVGRTYSEQCAKRGGIPNKSGLRAPTPIINYRKSSDPPGFREAPPPPTLNLGKGLPPLSQIYFLPQKISIWENVEREKIMFGEVKFYWLNKMGGNLTCLPKNKNFFKKHQYLLLFTVSLKLTFSGTTSVIGVLIKPGRITFTLK